MFLIFIPNRDMTPFDSAEADDPEAAVLAAQCLNRECDWVAWARANNGGLGRVLIENTVNGDRFCYGVR